ncbi:GFA family protein (plasmid) [Legionella sp. D16C41]|uniref:GFA family protein n=1 Tax=Legionella sp. D16C41 TaxID=3402688 RepID=UPI003AF40E28
MNKLTGKCLCGKIAYEIKGPLGPIVNCHCSKCRQWHGAAFRTRCTVESKNFIWIRGEEYLSKFPSSEKVIKTFCKICGSNLISLYKDTPEYIGLPIGGLEQDPGSRPIANIFVASKSPWYEITDNLPQYDELPNKDIDTILPERKK